MNKLNENEIVIKLDHFLINDLTDIIINYSSSNFNRSLIKCYINLDTYKKDKDFFHIGKILYEIKYLNIVNLKNYITTLVGEFENSKYFILCYSEMNLGLNNSEEYKILKYKKYDKLRKLIEK